MTDTAQTPTDFDSSARRFEEAAAAIDEIRRNIATLADIKEQQDQATTALRESNASLRAAVEALAPVGELGADMLASLKSAVAAAESVLDQETVKAIRDDIASLSLEVAALRDSTTAERDQALKELADLQAKVAALPERTRKKHGLG